MEQFRITERAQPANLRGCYFMIFSFTAIQNKISLLFFALLVLAMGLNGWLLFRETEKAVISSAIGAMHNDLDHFSLKMEAFHGQARSTMGLALENRYFNDYFSLPETLHGNFFDADGHLARTEKQKILKEQINRWANSIEKLFPIVEICLIDRTGQEHARISHGKPSPDEDLSSDERVNPFFKHVLKLSAGQVYVSPPYLSPDVDEWVFAYISPVVLDDGSMPAFFHFEIPVRQLRAFLTEETNVRNKKRSGKGENPLSDRIFIQTGDGLVIVDNERNIDLTRKTGKNTEGEQRLQDYLPHVRTISSDAVFSELVARAMAGVEGQGHFTMGSMDYYVSFKPLSEFGWSLVRIKSYENLLEGDRTLSNIRNINVIVTLVVIVFSFMVVWIVARWMTRPLQIVSQAMHELEKNRFCGDVPVVSKDEIGRIAKAFNDMNHEVRRNQEFLLHARDQAEHSERMLRLILDTIPVWVFWKDLGGVYRGGNIHFAQAAGFETMEEVIGKTDADLCWSQNAEKILKMDEQVVAGRINLLNVELFYGDCTGQTHWIDVSKVPLLDGGGKVIGILGASQDITLRVKARDEMHRNETRLRTIMDNVNEAIITTDRYGNILTVNQAVGPIFNYNPEELLGENIRILLPARARHHHDVFIANYLSFHQLHVQGQIDKHLRGEVFFNREMQGERRDGSIVLIELSITHVRMGDEVQFIATARDITRRKDAEEKLKHYSEQLENMVRERTRQLVHAERLATLGTFSAGMAHEINNPNSFISGNIDFLQNYWNLARPILEEHQKQDKSGRVGSFLGEVDATLEGMKDGSRRISKIVDSLKTYSRGGMEADKVECRLLDPVMDAQYLLQHRLKKGFLVTTTVPNDLLVVCDRQQLSQVFVNLFSNAMDALETQGEAYEKRIKIIAEKVDGHLWIRVIDNGPGIPEDVMGRIFDPFFTSKGKTKGTGLGLAIVHGIIEDHAGQITAHSSPSVEVGAEFVIVLPERETYYKIRSRSSKV